MRCPARYYIYKGWVAAGNAAGQLALVQSLVMAGHAGGDIREPSTRCWTQQPPQGSSRHRAADTSLRLPAAALLLLMLRAGQHSRWQRTMPLLPTPDSRLDGKTNFNKLAMESCSNEASHSGP